MCPRCFDFYFYNHAQSECDKDFGYYIYKIQQERYLRHQGGISNNAVQIATIPSEIPVAQDPASYNHERTCIHMKYYEI
jgi:hypothetical protein